MSYCIILQQKKNTGIVCKNIEIINNVLFTYVQDRQSYLESFKKALYMPIRTRNLSIKSYMPSHSCNQLCTLLDEWFLKPGNTRHLPVNGKLIRNINNIAKKVNISKNPEFVCTVANLQEIYRNLESMITTGLHGGEVKITEAMNDLCNTIDSLNTTLS